MNIYSIKTIIFITTFLILCISIFQIKNKTKQENLFLLSSSLVTLIITAILSIKLHHILRDEYSISNTITYLIISIPIIIYFYKFKELILKTNFVILIISFGFLGIAVIIDLLTDGKILNLKNFNLTEEILRILGSFFWMLYFLSFALKLRNK